MRIDFDFCVYALGSHLPPPINIWSGPGPLPIQPSTTPTPTSTPSSSTTEASSVTLARKNLLHSHNENNGRVISDSSSSDQETDLNTDSSSQSDDFSSDFSKKLQLDRNGKGRNDSSDGMTSTSSYDSISSDRAPSNGAAYASAKSKGLLPLSPPSSKHPSHGSLRSEAIRKEEGGGIGIKVQLPLCRGTKKEGMAWLEDARKRIEEASSVLVIGGGALGVREYFWVETRGVRRREEGRRTERSRFCCMRHPI